MEELISHLFAFLVSALLGGFLIAFTLYMLKSSDAVPSKDKRPWWRRKRFLMPLVLVVGLVALLNANPQERTMGTYALVELVLASIFFILIGSFLIAVFHALLVQLNVIPSGDERLWWERKRYAALLILLALLVFLTARYIPQYLHSQPGQDVCEFGTGSTALYDRMRGEADVYLKKHGYAQFQAFTSEMKQLFAREIEAQLQDFAMSRLTATERWAAVHALLRAYGMEFDNNGPDDWRLATRRVHLRAYYHFLLPKFKWDCLHCLLAPKAKLSIFMRPRRVRGRGVYDQVHVRTHTQHLSFQSLWWSPQYFVRKNLICPKVLN